MMNKGRRKTIRTGLYEMIRESEARLSRQTRQACRQVGYSLIYMSTRLDLCVFSICALTLDERVSSHCWRTNNVTTNNLGSHLRQLRSAVLPIRGRRPRRIPTASETARTPRLSANRSAALKAGVAAIGIDQTPAPSLGAVCQSQKHSARARLGEASWFRLQSPGPSRPTYSLVHAPTRGLSWYPRSTCLLQTAYPDSRPRPCFSTTGSA